MYIKKAFLLAAGFGTRLRPLTDTTPKCLIEICGKPLMGWWLDLFETHGVEEVLVNTHYLSEQVREFIRAYNAENHPVRIREFYEEELLGSGGTVAANRDFVGEDESFFICYADNLTDMDLTALARTHESHNGILTMALFHTNVPRQCGIAAVDEEGRITEFVEKPDEPKSDLANAGVYVARRELFRELPAPGTFCDFGKDVLPRLVGRMYGCETKSYLIDIGTHENLRRARESWKHDHI